MKKWVGFLEENNICHRDCEGNMPCDNGVVCDKCQADWVDKLWKENINKED